MSTFDYDDDVRREESDELHGHAGGWFDRGKVDRALGLVGIDTDPTPPHGIDREVEQ